MLREYINQNIQIKRIISKNNYGDVQTETITIKGRLQFKNKLRINNDGEQVVSTAILYTQQNVNLDDLILYNNKEFRIIEKKEIIDLNGNLAFLEVYI